MAAALVGGCYTPDFGDGGFLCNTERCPEGYACKLEGRDSSGKTHQVCRQAPLRPEDPAIEFRVVDPVVVGGDKGWKLTLEVTKTAHFVLDAANFGRAAAPGHGHYHVFFDNTEPYILASPEQQVQVTVPKAAPGEHWLRMVLFNNDHTPYEPWTEWAEGITVTK